MAKWMQDHLRKRLLEGTDARALGRADATACYYAGGYQVTDVLVNEPERLAVMASAPRPESWVRLSIGVDADGSGPVQSKPATPSESASESVQSQSAIPIHESQSESAIAVLTGTAG